MQRVSPPWDEEGPFIQSFPLDQEEEIRQFFDEYGFVVVRDVLSAEECEASVQEIVNIIEEHSAFRFDDASTWKNWTKKGNPNYGQAQREPHFTSQFLKNRQNPRVLQAFAILHQVPVDQLIVSHDRGCLYRPSGVNPGFRTRANVHLDLDPWGSCDAEGLQPCLDALEKLTYDKGSDFIFENNQVHQSLHLNVQGGLNLMDNEYQDGGFVCVPGFSHYFSQWKTETQNPELIRETAERNSMAFPPESWITQQAERIPMRAGSIVIWDQRLPHGSMPNASDRFRSAQFIKAFPNHVLHGQKGRRQARRLAIQNKLAQVPDFQVSELGEKVFDLKR